MLSLQHCPYSIVLTALSLQLPTGTLTPREGHHTLTPRCLFLPPKISNINVNVSSHNQCQHSGMLFKRFHKVNRRVHELLRSSETSLMSHGFFGSLKSNFLLMGFMGFHHVELTGDCCSVRTRPVYCTNQEKMKSKSADLVPCDIAILTSGDKLSSPSNQ